jgi:hypothetical protein
VVFGIGKFLHRYLLIFGVIVWLGYVKQGVDHLSLAGDFKQGIYQPEFPLLKK